MDENEAQNFINNQEAERLAELHKTRSATNNLQKAYGGTKAIAGSLSLSKYINWIGDFPYLAALIAALIKDLLDYTGTGSFPAIGTVVTFCCSIFIFFMMLLTGSGSKRKKAKIITSGPMRRYLVLLLGTLMEMLFGLNFFPIETAIVVVVYWMVLKERMIEESQEET